MRQQHLVKGNRDIKNESDKEMQTNIYVKDENKNKKIDKRVDQIMKTCWKVINRLI